MTGIVGMVAKRRGEVLGVVFDHYRDALRTLPAGGEPQYIPGAGEYIAAILSPDGLVFRIREADLTFHPADPAPHPSFESVRLDAWRVAEGISRKYKGLRQSLRTTLGLPAEAMDAEIVASVRSIIHTAESAIENAKPAWAAQRAVPFQSHEWEDEDDNRTLCAACQCTRLDSGHHDRSIEECPARLRDFLGEAPAVDADADQMTADPPPPAPPGEERWYRWHQMGSEYRDLDDEPEWLRVRGQKCAATSESNPSSWVAAEAISTWTEDDRRSPHPVLPPLWADDAWTTDPLPEAPETGSRWWGWDGANPGYEVVWEQTRAGLRLWTRHDGKVKRSPDLFDSDAISRRNLNPKRRTVSPIARPEWCRE